LIEAAQAYSYPARISRVILKRQEAVPSRFGKSPGKRSCGSAHGSEN